MKCPTQFCVIDADYTLGASYVPNVASQVKKSFIQLKLSPADHTPGADCVLEITVLVFKCNELVKRAFKVLHHNMW